MLLGLIVSLDGCAIASTSADQIPATVQALPIPADVKAFIDRRMGCNHWSGEGSEEEVRTREIRRAIADLQCKKLAGDERALRARYARTPVVTKTLDDTREWTW